MKDRIRQIRKTAGLNQTEFGKRVGVSISAVQKWESGENIVSDAVIKLICREFSIDEGWLRTGVGSMQRDTGREEEMALLVRRLMADRPESFRSALITTLLRFDPEGPEWQLLEDIYNRIADEKKSAQD